MRKGTALKLACDPGRAVPAIDDEPHKDYRSDVKPEGFESTTSRPVTQAGAAVLLVQDTAPWGMVANEEVLGANGIAFDRINSSLLSTTDLSAYRLVIVSSDQPTSFYATYASYQAQVDAFVAAGGTLEFHAAGWGWRGGNASLVTLPGGMRIEYYSAGSNHVLDPSHPLVAGVPDPFTGSSASHSHFTSIPAGAAAIVADDLGIPNLVMYRFGAGTVVASGQTLEIAYDGAWPAKIILQNMIPYTHGLVPAWLQVAPLEGIVRLEPDQVP